MAVKEAKILEIGNARLLSLLYFFFQGIHAFLDISDVGEYAWKKLFFGERS